MPYRKRPRIESTEDWSQLQLQLAWPEQVSYELIRPVVLFGWSPAERAKQTGNPERTLRRKADRFDAEGIASVFEPIRPATPRAVPPAMRRAIAQLKVEYAPFRPNDLAKICYIRFGRRPSLHTIRRILAEEPAPVHVARRYRPYGQIAEPIERRLAIVRLHAEGWISTSIAGYLQTNRARVYKTLKRWIDEGLAGMEDKSHAPRRPARKTDLAAINAVRKLQVNPELGAFRMHAALLRLGIELSPRTCGRILALNRRLYGLPDPSKQPHTPQEMPFKAARRHQYWTVALRYLDHQLGDGNVYCLSILENYRRAILASGLSRTQDLSAFLIVFFAAVRQHGAPAVLVSDSGGIFLGQRSEADLPGAPHSEGPDRPRPGLAVLYRDQLQHPAADGGLALRPSDHLAGAAGGLRPLGRRLQLPGPLGAPGSERWAAEPGRGPELGGWDGLLG